MPRPSPVTDTVRRLLLADDHHAWSLDELHTAVRRSIPGADYSTVFRAVAALDRSGSVDRLDVGDGRVRYEARREHHEHIRCTSCGSVQAVFGCVLDEAVAGVESSTGFAVSGHQLTFSGLCPDCQGRGLRP